jgi:hypothetical protein
MYATTLNISLYDFVRDSQRLNVVLSGRDFYVAFRDSISRVLATILLALVLPIVWIFVHFIRRRLEKRIPNGISITFDNYAEVRKAYDTLHTIAESLQKIHKANIQSVPFWLRGFMREVQQLATVLCKTSDSIATALNVNNNAFPKSTQNVFQPISDDVLWLNRPKTYQYRL